MLPSASNLRRLLLTLGLLLLGNAATQAHDSRPLYVEITEMAPAVFTVRWKAPASLPIFAIPEITLPPGCTQKGEKSLRQQPEGYVSQIIYQCEGALSGGEVAVQYPNNNPAISTLLRVSLWNGEQHSKFLSPDESRWAIPAAESVWGISTQYTRLGIEHIVAGIDHLLFVACLTFIARTRRRILITITGFTVAHSLTLVLATLGLVTLPVAPVEAVIALSIVFLAHEIAVANPISWTWRYPVAVSTSFGLLHGFGFASVLAEIGLPQTEKVTALLFFNIGVEIGQIAFVVALTALAAVILRQPKGVLLNQRSANRLASYFIGTVASVWLIDRLAGF